MLPKVLIGFSEALAAPEVVWSLVDAGFEVFAFSRRRSACALRYSRHVVVYEIGPPEKDLHAAQTDLLRLMETLGAKAGEGLSILFPLDDTAVWLCNTLPLGPVWQTVGPQGIRAELALNKNTQTQMAAKAGFNVPITQIATKGRDVLKFVERELFPIILRPADCVSVAENRVIKSRNWICASHDELSRALDEWRERVPLLVQPFILGVGEGIFGLASVDGVAAWSAHRRLRMMNPQGSGSSACVSQSVAEELKPKIETFLEMSDWRGLFMIELLRDRAGKTWFVEFNGRPWGSMALSRRQGLEYPAWHLGLAIDTGAVAKIPPVMQVDHVCRNLGREIMHLLFVLRGPKSKAFNGWPSFWKTLAAIIRVYRGESFYNWRRDDLGVFVADCYYTIHGNLFKPRGY